MWATRCPIVLLAVCRGDRGLLKGMGGWGEGGGEYKRGCTHPTAADPSPAQHAPAKALVKVLPKTAQTVPP